MEHAKKLALVDPRLVETLLAHQPTTTTTHVLTKLDADMKTILDRTDLHEREKVLLYNQLLDRYNTIDEPRRQQPVRVSMVNPSGEAPTVLPPTTVDPSPAVSSLLESEIVESAPKTMKKRVGLQLEKMKADPTTQWNERGEFVYNGALFEEATWWTS